jgi:hypothetical protein
LRARRHRYGGPADILETSNTMSFAMFASNSISFDNFGSTGMTTATVNATSKAKPAATPAIGMLFDVEQNSLDAATRMYTSLFGNVVRAQTEMFRFLSARFAKDASMLEQFTACKSPSDVAQLQLKLGSDAVADYLAETQRLIGMFEKASGETLAQAS